MMQQNDYTLPVENSLLFITPWPWHGETVMHGAVIWNIVQNDQNCTHDNLLLKYCNYNLGVVW